MKYADSTEYMGRCGFHDNNITSVYIDKHDVVINLDDLYANLWTKESAAIPGFVRIVNCVSVECNYLISGFVVDGELGKDGERSWIVLTLNTGAKLKMVGDRIEIIEK
jgi:hypothetical protein